jgi:hypothetical protein
VAVVIKDQTRKQARCLGAYGQWALAAFAGKLVLDDLPELRIDDGIVLAR